MHRFSRSMMKFLFSCTPRSRFFLGKNCAKKRISPRSERSGLLAAPKNTFTPSRQVVLHRTNPKDVTTHMAHPLASAKRSSYDQYLRQEQDKRQMEHVARATKMRKLGGWAPIELLRKYYDVVNASEGFDVPDLPKGYHYGTIHACDLKKNSIDELKVYSGAEAALQQFNCKNGTDYKFLDVVKTTRAVVRGLMFYVTFVGIARKARRFTTFEAKIWADLRSETKVTMCRKKVVRQCMRSSS